MLGNIRASIRRSNAHRVTIVRSASLGFVLTEWVVETRSQKNHGDCGVPSSFLRAVRTAPELESWESKEGLASSGWKEHIFQGL